MDPNLELEEQVELGSLWDFNIPFNHAELWAQRALLKLCRDLPRDFRITQRNCWIEDFKQWVTDHKNTRYPVPEQSFDGMVLEFLGNNSRHLSSVWIRDGR